MAILPIITAPDSRLKVQCDRVEEVTPEVVDLMDDMLVADVSKEEGEREPHQMVNPKILWTSEELFEYEEGCLSLPEQYADVIRPKQVRIKYLDKTGCSRIIEVEDLLSVCLQHEVDHLDGILFVDHISKIKRSVIMRKLNKMKKLQKKAG